VPDDATTGGIVLPNATTGLSGPVTAATDEAPSAGSPAAADAPPEDRNEVRVLGRISGEPERRILPSGDELVTFRVVVRRHPQGTDTFDVAVGPAPPAGVRRRPEQVGRRLLATAEALADGDHVEVEGELRRRWWGVGGRRQSRVEIRAGRLARA
jgi:single-strand DNA-binding protein